MKKPYIIPLKKRRKLDIILASFGAVVLGIATGLVWWAVASSGQDIIAVLTACVVTIGFLCALMALITGRMAWLLLEYWLPY